MGFINGEGGGGLYLGGLTSGIKYSFAIGWAYIPGGLKRVGNGGLKSGILRYVLTNLQALLAF